MSAKGECLQPGFWNYRGHDIEKMPDGCGGIQWVVWDPDERGDSAVSLHIAKTLTAARSWVDEVSR
jgi:hypothetical protein